MKIDSSYCPRVSFVDQIIILLPTGRLPGRERRMKSISPAELVSSTGVKRLVFAFSFSFYIPIVWHKRQNLTQREKDFILRSRPGWWPREYSLDHWQPCTPKNQSVPEKDRSFLHLINFSFTVTLERKRRPGFYTVINWIS